MTTADTQHPFVIVKDKAYGRRGGTYPDPDRWSVKAALRYTAASVYTPSRHGGRDGERVDLERVAAGFPTQAAAEAALARAKAAWADASPACAAADRPVKAMEDAHSTARRELEARQREELAPLIQARGEANNARVIAAREALKES